MMRKVMRDGELQKGNKTRELADVVEVLKRFPDVFDEVKDSGAFEKIGYEVTDDGLIKKKSNSGAKSENQHRRKYLLLPHGFQNSQSINNGQHSVQQNNVIAIFGIQSVVQRRFPIITAIGDITFLLQLLCNGV